MILSYFVDATTGVCWRFDVFENSQWQKLFDESELFQERLKCDSTSDMDTIQQTRVYMKIQ